MIHKDGSEEETESYTVGPGNQNKDGSVSEEEKVTIIDHQHPKRSNRHITVQHFLPNDESEAAGLPDKKQTGGGNGESSVSSSNDEALAVIRGEERNEPVSEKHKAGGVNDNEIDSAREALEHKAIADAKTGDCEGCAQPKKVTDKDVIGAADAAVRLLNDEEKTRDGPPGKGHASGQREGYVSLGKVRESLKREPKS